MRAASGRACVKCCSILRRNALRARTRTYCLLLAKQELMAKELEADISSCGRRDLGTIDKSGGVRAQSFTSNPDGSSPGPYTQPRTAPPCHSNFLPCPGAQRDPEDSPVTHGTTKINQATDSNGSTRTPTSFLRQSAGT